MNELVELITCKQCGQTKPASRSTPNWCEDCVKAYNNRYSYMRQHQGDWIEVAKESGLELWDRQPGETQLEWSIWQAYRDSYPGAKPSYKAVAAKVGSTYDFVVKTASRWNYQVRLQSWISECDRITIAQRRSEVLNMNAEHIAMAAKLRGKLATAIDMVDPAVLKPSDLNSLLKTAADLEKRARLDTMTLEAQQSEGFVDHENPDIKKAQTKQGDLGEVVQILLSAGALGDITHVGVRKTETTEVLVGDSNGATTSMIKED